MVESRGTFAPRRAYEPAVLFILSKVAMLFLIRIGRPWSGLGTVRWMEQSRGFDWTGDGFYENSIETNIGAEIQMPIEAKGGLTDKMEKHI
jgi:hypothetical protein